MSKGNKIKKIYIASSWKNVVQVRALANTLRQCGFEVDDFTDDSTGRYVFHYSEIGNLYQIDPISFLEDSRSQRAYQEDKKMIDWADAVVMVMPAGRSSHLEAGYAKGQGKVLIIYWPTCLPKGEFDVMYGFADLLTKNLDEVVDFLRGDINV